MVTQGKIQPVYGTLSHSSFGLHGIIAIVLTALSFCKTEEVTVLSSTCIRAFMVMPLRLSGLRLQTFGYFEAGTHSVAVTY